MRRLGGAGVTLTLTAALAIAFIAQSTMLGTTTPRFVSLALIAVLIVLAIAIAARARDSAPDGRWQRQGAAVEAVSRPPTTSWRVSGALSRVEARHLVFSPWFAAGSVLCMFFVIITGGVLRGDGLDRSWSDYFPMFPGMAHALVGMIVIASHRAATRAVRDSTDELFESCPADMTVRTLGFLRASWVPGAAIVAFMLATLAVARQLNSDMYGRITVHDAGYALSAVILGAGGIALGVALAQWWRWGLGGIVAVVAVGFASGRLGSIGEPHWSSVRELATWTPASPYSGIFTSRPVWWHAGWLLALVGMVAAIAIATHRRDRGVLVAGVACAVAAATCGIVATRPLSAAAAERIAGLVAHPTDHDTCIAARDDRRVLVCVYEQYPDFGRRVADDVRPIAEALPAATPIIRFQQVFDGKVSSLPVEVARLLPNGAARAAPALGFSHDPGSLAGNRFLVAAAAVGLPSTKPADKRPYVAAGQARGVVALWLATRGLSDRAALRLTRGRTDANGSPGTGPPDAFDRGYAWPDDCGGGAPVVWSAQDLTAAHMLLALPDRDVLRVVHGDWVRWTSSSTSTDDLLAALGRPAVGPFDRFETRVDASC